MGTHRYQHEVLYQRYAQLGKNMARSSLKQQWMSITQVGFWELPVDLGWQACFIALEALISTCTDQALVMLLMTQLNVLYLLLQYGTFEQKKAYLHQLVEGKRATIILLELTHRDGESTASMLKRYHWLDDYQKSSNLLEQANIRLLITHTAYANNKNDIIFFIYDRQDEKKTLTNVSDLRFRRENILIEKDRSREVLYDLIQVKRLLYGMLISHLALPMVTNYKTISRRTKSKIARLSPDHIIHTIEHHLKTGGRMLHHALDTTGDEMRPRLK